MKNFEGEKHERGQAEADDRRDDEALQHLGHLFPIHAGRAAVAVDELVRKPDADDGTDHGVRDDTGSPRHQVARFHSTAATSRAKIMAKPAPDPMFSTSSAGSRARIVYATSPLLVSTPVRLHSPDQTTATCGGSVWV